ncbi:hypothetical protein NQ036_06750 [Brevibacterium sp. 91QC2O2]|uniref:hypothetical protein n=1 Tax=Brevibacterium sp. 91QC2O2 TaxID=2968458 RepID=UPI00211C3C5E|nr:hypothetical protein [Brevibacterium sp. 91QC2O2]MCQ9367942.1 hypothetical protein [Brevibacterium sp. 91QC2O2]
MRAAARVVWERITEPKWVSILQAVVYVVLAAGATAQLIEPSPTIMEAWERWFTTVWAVMLITGGAIGACAAPTGVWWLERIAITACVTGICMYIIVLITHMSRLTGGRGMVIALALFALLSLGIRYLCIRGLQYEPGR